MQVLIGFVILIISIFMVINAGWNVLLIPLLMVSFFAYVVLMDIFVWKKQGRGSREESRSEAGGEDSSPDSAAEDSSSDSSDGSYSGDGGDFGGGGSSGSW